MRPATRRAASRRLALWSTLLLTACCIGSLPADAAATGNGSIRGQVTDASSHAGLSGAQVIVFDTSGGWVGSTRTAADGSYTVGLVPGSYVLQFSTTDGSHLGEYYDDAPALTAADPVAVAAGQSTTNVDAALAPAGQISGTVTDEATGLPVPGLGVQVYDGSEEWVASTSTDGRGRYRVGDLASGSYRVAFVPGRGQPYARQWASGRGTFGSADPITVTAGATTTGVDAQLVAHGVITGTVTDAATHHAAADVDVSVYDAAGGFAGSAWTDRDGAYAVGGLADGSYRVRFSSDYGAVSWAPQYFSGRTTLQAADPVTVSAGDPAVADAALAAGGRIQGTITDAATHQPMTQAWIEAFDAGGEPVAGTDVDDQGRYTLQGLASGSYRIEIAPFDQVHATSFYHSRSALDSADPVAVTAGQTTMGIDEALPTGGTIAGTVTDAVSGRPVAGASVAVYDASDVEVAEGTAAADGTYRVGGLTAGSYRVQVGGPIAFVSGGYASRWYGGLTFAAATPVAVTLNHTTGGADVALTGGGRIAGMITRASTHTPVAGATITVIYPGGAYGYWTATTAADGTYVVGGVPSGLYNIDVAAPTSNLAGRLYDQQPPIGLPDAVAVTAGTTTTGIDAALADGGAIAGTVTDAATHTAVRRATVMAFAAGDIVVQTTTTAVDGTYTLSGLSPGQYRIAFVPPDGSDLRRQYSGGAATLDDASLVTAPAGGTTHGVDAALAAGAAISGTVTAAGGGAPVGDADVMLYDGSGSLVDWSYTDRDGSYAFHAVAPGSYRVGFSAPGYLARFYAGAATLGAATPVVASAGATVAHVDAALPDGGAIRGTVTDAALDAPIGGVTVTAYDASTDAVVSTATTDAAGRYRVSGLPGGAYRVGYRVESYDFGPPTLYVPRYYPAAATLDAGSTVPVAAGQTANGVDAALQQGGDVEGTVTNATTHAPAAGVSVTVFDADGTNVGSATTGSDGSYTVPGLASGQYRVGFATAYGSRYVTRYYDDAATLDGATEVAVTAGARTTGVDAALTPTGSIAGTVTDAQTGQPVPGVAVYAQGVGGSSSYAYGYSDASGQYELSGLATGSYTVSTYVTSSMDYVAARYAGNPVSVTTGAATAGVDLLLQPAAHISGTLTDAATHAPVGKALVEALSTSGSVIVATATSRSDGTYDLGGLAAGSYKVEFAAPGGTANYRPGYYDGKGTYATADTVTLATGQQLPSIDGALQPGGEIDGTVTDAATAQAIWGAWVSVYDSGGAYVTSTPTRADGAYAVHGLPPGQYRLMFWASGHVSLFYDGKATLDQATAVTVAAGAATTGIDAAMPTGGAISGTVTDATTGDPLSGTIVHAETTSGDWLAGTVTDNQGRYTLTGVPAGTAIVHFTGDGTHSGEYYDDQASAADATRLTVTTGQTITGIDAALAPGGTINGTVTAADTGEGLAQVTVIATPTGGGGTTRVAVTDAAGQYTVGGLDAGTYQVTFSPSQNQNYVAATYPSEVSVASGQATTGIDQALRTGGQVSGTITDASTGDPLVGVNVSGASSGGEPPVSTSTVTDAQGHYTVAGLPSGEATISAYDGTGYHAQKSTAPGAVTVAVGSNVGGVDLALTPTGALSGTVTARGTDAPVGGAGVKLYDSGDALVSSALTGPDGRYRVGELAPGAYRVAFDAGITQADYGTIYYDGKATLADADALTVTAGHTTDGADGALFGPPANQSPPTITGTAKQGETLTAHHGAWTELPDTYDLQWLRCPVVGLCVPIEGATDATYTLGEDDALSTIELQETAGNAAGPGAPATSVATAVVLPLPPESTAPPAISGVAQQGQTLTAFDGEWRNHPTSFARQWQRCDAASAHCAAISGATGSTYVPVAADVGTRLALSVTATNAGGSSPAAGSAATARVVPPVPELVSAPAISGTPEQGQALTVQRGSWTNGPTSYVDQWRRCDAVGADCADVSGATGASYTPVAADVDHTLRVVETASNGGVPSAPAPSDPTAAITVPPLRAVAGEPVLATVGTPVTLNGSGSAPSGAIDSYAWDFGDQAFGFGAVVQHTYAAPGTYTAKLTIANAGHAAEATTTVTVVPQAPGARITVHDSGGTPLPGASLVYTGADGHRTIATTGPDGVGTLPDLPDGSAAVSVWKADFQPVVVTVDVSGGSGSATATLTPGELARTTLTSHPMTLSEITAAGIDVNDPANLNVTTFSVHLDFAAPVDGHDSTDFCGYINSEGQFVGDTGFNCGGGGGGSGGGGGCWASSCGRGSVVVTGKVVNGHPLITWLVLQGQVTSLKQFFSVNLVVDNLSDQPFSLSDGTASIDLPPGLSLAPTATPQSLTPSVPTIPGRGSATTAWIVRGDTPGFYGLTAAYHGRLQPFDAPVDLSATLADPLHVWGAEALGLKVQADSGALKAGRPYHVRIGVTNRADVPFYNVSLGIDPSAHERFVFQPDERFSDNLGELPAGRTTYGHAYVLVPDADSAGAFNPRLSDATFAGEPIRPGEGIEAVAPPKLYDLQAPTDAVGDVHLHWEPVPGAQGYQVFSTPDLDTPFADAPDSVQDFGGDQVTTLPPSAADAFIPVSTDSARQYAVSTIVGGHLTLEHPVVVGRPGVPPPDDTGGGGEGGGGAGGGGTGGGSEEGIGVPTPTPGCELSKVVVGGVTIQAACFARRDKGVLQARGRIRVGGLDLKTGGGFTIDPRALSLTSSGAADVYAGTLHIYHGDVSWNVQVHKSEHLRVPAGLTIKGLPVGGSIDADFTATGAEATATASIGNSASPFKTSGEVRLQVTPADGLKLDKLKLELDSDLKVQSLVVKQASLTYERTSGGDQWTGAVKADLPSGPEISAQLALLNGAVAEVRIAVDKINKPLGEVVFLQSLGLDVLLKPYFKATGSIGLTAGPKILGAAAAELDASLSVQLQPHFVLSANGDLTVVEMKVASASLTAQVPGGVSFSGDMQRGFPGFTVKAHIGGSIDSRHFEAEGGGSVNVPGASGSAKALVDDQGVAACANLQTAILHQSFTVGGGYNWRSRHKGLLDGACGFDDLRRTIANLSSVTARAAQAVAVPAPSVGKQVNLIVQGSGGAPTVELTHGSERVTVAPGTSGRFAGTEYVALSDPEGSRTGIILPRAPAGSVGVAPTAGGAPVSVSATGLLPSPNVRVKVRPLGHRRYRLTWTARRIRGQQLVLRETARGASTTLRATTAASGRLTFTALPVPTASHRIQVVVDQDGTPRDIVSSAATFHVAPPKLTRPRVQIARHGASATIRWSAVHDADHYEIAVTTSDGRRLFFSRPRSARSLRMPAARKISARVRAIGATLTAGPAGGAAIRK